MPTNLSKNVLATILSALDGQTRSPANRDKALAALERKAAALGLTTDEILDAAPGLLDGRLSPADWLAAITDTDVTEPAAEEAAAVDADMADGPAQGPVTEPDGADGGARESAAAVEHRPQPREGTKQAQLIAMLRRPGGADLDEIAEATHWAKHTIRGAISGALKKKLGLEVTSEKDQEGRRVYRLA